MELQRRVIPDVVDIAWELVDEFHAGQMYGDKPYRYHLEAVLNSITKKWGTGNRALMAIAILHDILEDTSISERTLINKVGKDITKCIVALSKVEGEPYEEYIYRVREYHYSKEVKIHDTLCNLTESIMSDSAHRVRKYSNQLQLLVRNSDPIKQ